MQEDPIQPRFVLSRSRTSRSRAGLRVVAAALAIVLAVEVTRGEEPKVEGEGAPRSTAPRVEIPTVDSVVGLTIPLALREARLDVVMTITAEGATHLGPRVAVRRDTNPRIRDPRSRLTPPLVVVVRADAAARFGTVAEVIEDLEAVGADAVHWMVRDPSGREARLTMPESPGSGRLRRDRRVPEVEVALRSDGQERIEVLLRSTKGDRRETVEPDEVAQRLLILLGSEQVRNPGFALRLAPSADVPFDAVARALDVARRLEVVDRRLVFPPLLSAPIVSHAIDLAPVTDPHVVVTLDATGDPWVDGIACDDIATVLALVRRIAEARRAEDGDSRFVVVLEADGQLPFEAIAPMLTVAAGPGFALEDIRFVARTPEGVAGTVPVVVYVGPDRPAGTTILLETEGGRTSIQRQESEENATASTALIPQSRTPLEACVRVAAELDAVGQGPVVLLPLRAVSEDDE